jgi:hypothetical protein
VGGNFFVYTYQIVLLAVAAGGPPFIALCFSCSTLIAGLLDNEKNIKLVYFLCIPRSLVSLRHGKRQSLPVEPGQPCAGAYQRLDSGNSSAHREREYAKYAGPASETELEASYAGLEEGEGGDRHYCSVLEGDMSSVNESRGAPNEAGELDASVLNGGWNHAKLHS